MSALIQARKYLWGMSVTEAELVGEWQVKEKESVEFQITYKAFDLELVEEYQRVLAKRIYELMNPEKDSTLLKVYLIMALEHQENNADALFQFESKLKEWISLFEEKKGGEGYLNPDQVQRLNEDFEQEMRSLFGEKGLNDPSILDVFVFSDNYQTSQMAKQVQTMDRIRDLLKARATFSQKEMNRSNPWLKYVLVDHPLRLHSGQEISLHEMQKMALGVLGGSNLLMLTGGPGTGKTSVVANILRFLILRDELSDSGLIGFAAPTGKAAVRLTESLKGYDVEKSVQDVWDTISGETIHRMLDYRPGSGKFRHNKENPLEFKVVVMDEVSMADAELVLALLDALPLDCIVIMVGDVNQLPPINGVSVLRNVLNQNLFNTFPKELEVFSEKYLGQQRQFSFLEVETSVSLSTVQLIKVYRSDIDVIRLANYILNDTYSREDWSTIPVITNRDEYNTEFNSEPLLMLSAEFHLGEVLRYWADRLNLEAGPLLEKLPHEKNLISVTNKHELDSDLLQLMRKYNDYKILCTHRVGERGVENINDYMKSISGSRVNGDPYGSTHLSLAPIMIMVNHFELNIFNGDTGLLVYWEDKYWGVFEDGESLRWVPEFILPKWEYAFASTVHKSQGSEYTNALLVMNQKVDSLFNKEMMYTAVTRAKKRVHISVNPDSIPYLYSKK